MAYNKQYYQDKYQQLQQKNQQILQRLVNAAFDFVNEVNDWQERLKELREAEQLSIREESAKVKTDEKIQTPKEGKGEQKEIKH